MRLIDWNSVPRRLALSLLALSLLFGAGCSMQARQTPATQAEVPGAETSSASAAVEAADKPALVITPNPYLQAPRRVSASGRRIYTQALDALRQQQWQSAEQLLKRLTIDEPKLSGPHLNLGLLYRQTGSLENAEKSFRRAIDVNPNNLDAYNQLAILKREAGDFQTAETLYLQALDIWPQHATSHRNIGILYDLYLGNFDQALAHYQTYQSLQAPPDRQLVGWIVDLQRRMKELARAPAQASDSP